MEIHDCATDQTVTATTVATMWLSDWGAPTPFSTIFQDSVKKESHAFSVACGRSHSKTMQFCAHFLGQPGGHTHVELFWHQGVTYGRFCFGKLIPKADFITTDSLQFE